jgi:hypothetical protein
MQTQNNVQSTGHLTGTYDTNIAQINANQSYYISSTQNRHHNFHRLRMTALDYTDESVQTMSSLGDDDDDDDDGTEVQVKFAGRCSFFPSLLIILYHNKQL